MILLDTSVWIDHLRRSDRTVVQILESGFAAVHPFVIGELACGNLRSRAEVLGLLQSMPMIGTVTDDEVLHLIESRHLMGQGIGYVDAHLLAATTIDGALLWTRDRRLRDFATSLNIAYADNGD